MKQEARRKAKSPSRLQRDLLPRLVALIRSDGLADGARLPETALAERLQVSRTPVRAALRHLARQGLLDWRPRRGFVLAKPVGASEAAKLVAGPPPEMDRVLLAIARDRQAGRLPDEVSEADLIRRYGVARPLLLRVLTKLAEVALVERKPGHGWHFLPTLDDPRARAESYSFRRLVEPTALLEPTFALDPAWLREMRRRHREMLAAPWRETTSIALFEMNAAFHEGLAAASGNRYFFMAVQQQTRLRRFGNYDWRHGHERVVASCTEHLEILERLERGEREVAAALLRAHIDKARRARARADAAAAD
jgi:DNA-binding GntR family transcriptional regulator